MFKFLGAILLLAFLVNVNCEEGPIEVTEVNTKVLETKPENVAILTQLKSIPSDSSSTIYTYKCTVGTQRSTRLACTAHDSTSWSTAHNVELKLRCPRVGSGLTLSYAEIIYSVSSNSVNCFVNEGAVGLGYLGVTVQAWNTLIFNYSAQFFTY